MRVASIGGLIEPISGILPFNRVLEADIRLRSRLFWKSEAESAPESRGLLLRRKYTNPDEAALGDVSDRKLAKLASKVSLIPEAVEKFGKANVPVKLVLTRYRLR